MTLVDEAGKQNISSQPISQFGTSSTFSRKGGRSTADRLPHDDDEYDSKYRKRSFSQIYAIFGIVPNSPNAGAELTKRVMLLLCIAVLFYVMFTLSQSSGAATESSDGTEPVDTRY